MPNITYDLLAKYLQGSLANVVQEGRNWAEKIHAEVPNITHDLLGEHLQSLVVLRNDSVPRLARATHQAAALPLSARALSWTVQDAVPLPSERYCPAGTDTFESYLSRAEADFPEVFDLWRDRLASVERAFDQSKVNNAANAADLYSRVFADLVKVHARGRVLDVGCGVFGRPYYLQDYPAALVSGLEPLPMKEGVDFELVRGIGEYLPWPDASFSTVVSATSLDHCLSLDRSLEEMRRVLTDDGRLLLWLGLVPGSPRFEPTRPGFQPADQYHLFHFDKDWVEPLLEKDFALVDKIEFDMLSSYAHGFYVLRKQSAAAGTRS